RALDRGALLGRHRMRHPGSSVVLLLLASACATVRREPATEPQVSATPSAVKQATQPPPAQEPPPSELAPPQQPPAAAARPLSKASTQPNIFGELTLAGGVYEHDTRNDGSVFTGHTSGGFARMRGEYIFDQGIGAGMALEGSGSDDKLFGETGNLD